MSTREFTSIVDFIGHLAAVEVAFSVAEHNMLDRAAAVIEANAKARIGHYQAETGAFNAWPELADSTVADRVSKGYSPDEPLLRKGDLRGSYSRAVEGNEAVVGSTSDIAVYQELGTSKIPPRPVLGPAAFDSKDKVEAILGHAVLHIFEYGAAGAFVPLPE